MSLECRWGVKLLSSSILTAAIHLLMCLPSSVSGEAESSVLRGNSVSRKLLGKDVCFWAGSDCRANMKAMYPNDELYMDVLQHRASTTVCLSWMQLIQGSCSSGESGYFSFSEKASGISCRKEPSARKPLRQTQR
jgi:hypothetical protein